MSKEERIVSSLEPLSDLCFTISELVIADRPGEKKDAGPSSSGLSVTAKAFEPSRKGKEKLETVTSKVEEGKPSVFEGSWEDLYSESSGSSSVSSDTPPSFSQVVGSGSQFVVVTPVSKV